MFFKDGQKEEMACEGATVVEALIHAGDIESEKFRSATKQPRVWKRHKAILERHVCNSCSFQKEDCDFQSPQPSEDLEPCGGFILLAFLFENNLLDEGVLENCNE